MIISKVIKVVIGSSLQWYDFALYGFFSSIFAQQFFPNANPQVALLNSLCTFAIGFVARPLGAILFGRYGDIYGRTKILKITPLLITVPTLMLACIPTYDQIGIFAPILLILNRIMQGIFLGAEFGGNMVYLCESEPNRKFLLGSLGSCSGSFGILIASLISSLVSILPPDQFISFGWRITFALSIVPGVIAWYLRRNMPETQVYQHLIATNNVVKNPLRDVWLQKRSLFTILGILCFQASTFYYVFMFLPNYTTDKSILTIKNSFSLISLVLAIRLCIIPLFGWLADRFSGVIIYYVSTAFFAAFSIILSKSFCNGIESSFLFLAIMSAINAGVVPGIITTMLQSRSRYTLFSLVFNFGFGLFGGCTPAFCVYLGTLNHNLPFILPVCTSIIGAVSLQLFTRFQGNGYERLQQYTGYRGH